MNIVEYADVEMMMMWLADQIASELENVLLTQPHASLAVPGGTTPGPIFDNLSSARLDWSRVRIMLTDERWVPESSERSNTRLLRERLLVNRAAEATYIPLFADAPTPEEKLPALQQGLAPALPVSVMLLGMGADMHTASLFPGADRLHEALMGSETLVAMRAPGAPEPRITLSAAVLRGALSRHIVIIGDEKRAALEKARHLPPTEAPVSAVLGISTIHWSRG